MSPETLRFQSTIVPALSPLFDPAESAANGQHDPDVMTILFRRTYQQQIKLAVGEELVIGRRHDTHAIQPDLDLTNLNAPAYGISRLHCKIRHESNGWTVQDLASANGTWINGEKLQAFTPVTLDVRTQLTMSTMHLHLLLPQKVVGGVSVPTLQPHAKPLHVVNIEDDHDLQTLLGIAFKETDQNLNLQQFVNGDYAIPYIMQHGGSIDLFVIDIMLPGKYNGIQIAQFIRSLGCPGHIALTSAFAEPPRDLLNSIRAEFFLKPMHILDIIPKLASYRLPVEQAETTTQASKAEAKRAEELATLPLAEIDATAQLIPVGHDFAAHYAPTIPSRKQLGAQIEVLESYQKPADDDTPPPQIQHITPFTRGEGDEKSRKVNLVQRLINRLRGVS